jgi:stearoyl-CoA desaturase (delta-9 desaturase)
MAISGKNKVCSPDTVINHEESDQRNELDAEMELNGQTYIDREEVQKEQVVLVPVPNQRSKISQLCGFGWRQVKWSNVVWLLLLHVLFGWAFVRSCLWPVKVQSVVWTVFTSVFSGFGMSVGAHRLWAHRSFKANTLLRTFLLMLQTMTINGSALSYARDHRNHHKWPATDADPKNPARGFFFAHIGWWMLRKKADVAEFGRKVPIDDLIKEQMLVLQHRFYLPLVGVFAFLVPTLMPWLGWSEDPLTSFALCIIRIVVVLHHLFTVNSVAHFWGYRPYNR